MHPKLPFLWKSRNDLPHLLNDMGLTGVGVEVGTQRGFFAHHIRRHWYGRILLCVDPYAPYPGIGMTAEDHENAFRLAKQHVLGAAGGGREVLFIRDFSVSVARAYKGEPLDFVYIDADHDYESVHADIEAWWPLVKPGGVIAGHDYVVDGWHVHGEPFNAFSKEDAHLSGKACSPFFVRKAVHEIFEQPDVITSREEDGGWQSWLVVKP